MAGHGGRGGFGGLFGGKGWMSEGGSGRMVGEEGMCS